MQYRKVKNRIQVLAAAGYDKGKRRTAVKLLGSYDARTFALSEKLERELTPDQLVELQAHISRSRSASKNIALHDVAHRLHETIGEVGEAIASKRFSPSAAWEDGIVEAFRELRRAIGKSRRSTAPAAPSIVRRRAVRAALAAEKAHAKASAAANLARILAEAIPNPAEKAKGSRQK